MTDSTKSHVLLTGATGLLGRYLVRDLAEQNVPLAVLVRPSRRASAEERVDAILRFWKNESDLDLPRPKILAGNILDENFGLSAEEREWTEIHVKQMLHNAASLSFVSTGRHSEPWRSNVDGTENVLNFCEDAAIREFFHVSTAYVAGKREGVIKETEGNVGQEFGNCYEESKLMAEELVRAAKANGRIDQLTTFRPGIILGDSTTGFTSTFHHVYAAVQMAHVLSQQMADWDFTGKANASDVVLPMSGNERKHLVPVDWVSAVMAHVVAGSEHHGQTYHLTPRCPVRMRVLRDMIEQKVGYYGVDIAIDPGEQSDDTPPSEAQSLFMEQQEVYASYWRDDPLYDTTNTRKAAPHLPCPHIDLQMLMYFADVAIDMNFRFNDPKPTSRTKPTAAERTDISVV